MHEHAHRIPGQSCCTANPTGNLKQRIDTRVCDPDEHGAQRRQGKIPACSMKMWETLGQTVETIMMTNMLNLFRYSWQNKTENFSEKNYISVQ